MQFVVVRDDGDDELEISLLTESRVGQPRERLEMLSTVDVRGSFCCKTCFTFFLKRMILLSLSMIYSVGFVLVLFRRNDLFKSKTASAKRTERGLSEITSPHHGRGWRKAENCRDMVFVIVSLNFD